MYAVSVAGTDLDGSNDNWSAHPFGLADRFQGLDGIGFCRRRFLVSDVLGHRVYHVDAGQTLNVCSRNLLARRHRAGSSSKPAVRAAVLGQSSDCLPARAGQEDTGTSPAPAKQGPAHRAGKQYCQIVDLAGGGRIESVMPRLRKSRGRAIQKLIHVLQIIIIDLAICK